MICAACGEANREAARFCDGCGEPLSSRCATCENELRPGARFCDGCGVAVDDAPTEVAPKVDGARKVVTLVFADLAGSTSLQERMDAESVRRVMDRFYDVMREAITSHSGTVVKFMGDGLMAAFGVPTVAEDDAVRAVRAAAAMQEAFVAVAEEVSREWDAHVGLRVGVNTGEVVVAEGEDDVVGDAVNVAARLEHAAGESQVLVGQETWRLTRDLFTFDEVPALELKGKAERVPGYRLVSLTPPAAEDLSPFVGRDRELGCLTDVFETAVEGRRAQLVTIVGSPGLGKSRLVRELARRLGSRARIFEGQCEVSGASTFAPVAEVLRQAAAIDETALADDVVTALAGVFPEGDDDAERIATATATVLGVGGAASPEETFWAIRRVIEQVAQPQPAVVVFDDVHWAEPMFLDLLEHLADWIREAPVLLVALARPEIRDVRAALADSAGTPSDVIVLDALPDDEGMRLASKLLQGHPLDGEVAARLLASAEGNPLFLRELVKMLFDDGVLHLEDGVWVAAEGAEVDVPPTINALLAARIERLGDDERSVVERASVVGQQFFRGAVSTLSTPPVAAQIDAHLETLRRKEVVEPEGTYWIDEPVFRFHHGLIRDAAYRRLLKEARAELHERVADWLALKAGDLVGEHEEVIGFHLEQAHQYRRDLGGAEAAAALGERAAAHLGAAARRSLDRDDLRSAAALMGRAVACLPADHARRAELLVDRCEALLGLGEVTVGAEALAELQAAAEASPRLAAWAEAFAAQLASFSEPGELPAWVGRAAAAADRFEELGDPVGTAKAAAVHASILARLGHMAACETALDRALAAAREAGDRRRANGVLAGAPVAALWGPSPVTRAAGRCLDVVRVLRITTDSPPVEAVALRAQGVLEAFRGRFDAARRLVTSSARTLEELGLRHGMLQTQLFTGLVELAADDPEAAEAPLREAYDGFRTLGVGVDAAQAGALLARACLAQGRDDEALELTQESERLGGHDLKTAIAWRAVRAEALARRGEGDEALRLARDAVAIAAETDALVDHADARLALATVLAAGGDTEEATTEARRAAELYEAKGATALVEWAQRLAGGRPASRGNVETREAPATEALSNFATEAFEAYAGLVPEKDVEGIVALVAPDYVLEERGPSAQTTISGHEGVRQALRVMFEVDCRVEFDVLATRLSRLSLVDVMVDVRDPLGGEAEHPVLRLDETDEHGLLVRTIHFAPDDVDAAYDELDRRFVTIAGVPDGGFIRAQRVLAEAYASGDPERILDVVFASPDVEVVDHRRVGWGRITAAEYAGLVAGTKELVSVTELRRVAVFRYGPPFAVARQRLRGTGAEGEAFEMVTDAVTKTQGGRIAYMEMYDPEDLERALARFDELTGDGESTLTNAVTSVWDRYRALFPRHDVDGIVATVSADYRLEERQHHAQFATIGRDGFRDLLEALFHGEFRGVETEVLATRGNRLALVRVVWHVRAQGGGDADVVHLRVDEANAEGLLTASMVFDADDLDAAYDELNRRLADHVEPSCRPIVEAVAECRRALNDRDWDGLKALLADDFVHVSDPLTPSGVLGELDATTLVGQLADLVDKAPDHEWYDAETLRVAPGGILHRRGGSGTALGGIRYDRLVYALEMFREGKFWRTEIFHESKRAEALARFDELAGGQPPAPHADSLAARAWDRGRRATEAGDVDGLLALMADDVTYEERTRTSGLFEPLRGKEALAEMYSIVFTGRVHFPRLEVLATRGARLVLTKATLRWTDGRGQTTEHAHLRLDETDEAGLIVASILFEADDLEAAYDELDRRFLGHVGAECRPILKASAARRRALNARDWEGLEALLAEDFVSVTDQRLVGTGDEDAAAVVRALADIVDHVASDAVFYDVELLGLAPDHVLHRMRSWGTGIEGGTYEVVTYHLEAFRGGRIHRVESFDESKRTEALARFDELRAGQTPDLHVGNLALAAEAQAREAVRAGDLEGVLAMMSDDIIYEERTRTGMLAPLEGKDTLTDIYARVLTGDLVFQAVEVLATRGDRLALQKATFSWQDDSGTETEHHHLRLDETDGDGKIVATIFFEVDDIDAALDELDKRFVAHLHAACRPIVEASSANRRAYNARDWEVMRSLLASDFVLVDQRPAGWGQLDADAYIETLRGFLPLAPDVVMYSVDCGLVEPDRVFGRTVSRGTDADGGPFEVAFDFLGHFTNGVFHRIEISDPSQRDEVLADLRGTRSGDSVKAGHDNSALRAWATGREGMSAGDVDAILATTTKEHVYEERRRPPARFVLNGQEELGQMLTRMLAGGEWTIDADVVATRGARLALTRNRAQWVDPSGGVTEYTHLRVDEADEAGMLTATVVFDSDDLDAAMDELDERYLGHVDPACKPLLTHLRDSRRAVNARDWNALGGTASDDFQLLDHRLTGFGERDADQYVEGVQSMVELAPDVVSCTVEIPRLAPHCALTRSRAWGTDPEGGPFENVVDVVTVYSDGRVPRIELFDPAQRERAVARFEELVADQSAGPDPINLAVEAWARAREAMQAGDVAGVVAAMAEDGSYEERRSTPGRLRLVGREQVAEMLTVMGVPHGAWKIDTEVVATRGARLALTTNRSRLEDSTGGLTEYENFRIDETDEAGSITATVLHGPDDLEAAMDELDERYLAHVDADCVPLLQTLTASRQAYNRHDLEALRATFSDDYRLIDHRTVGWGECDRDAHLDRVRGLLALAPDLGIRYVEVVRLSHRVALVRTIAGGTDEKGGPFEFHFDMLAVYGDGRVRRLEFFDAEDRAHSLARFEEVVAETSESLGSGNLALRAWEQSKLNVLHGEVDPILANVAEEFVYEERRAPPARFRLTGRTELAGMLKTMARRPAARIDTEVVALRGARLVLTRNTLHGTDARGGGDYEAPILRLDEADDAGRFVATVVFEPEDLDAAFEELDARFRARLPAAHQAMVDRIIEARRSYNAHDWDGMRRQLTDDFVLVDHRPGWFGTLDADTYIERMAALPTVASDTSIAVVEVPHIAPNAAVIRWSTTGTGQEGGPFEITFDSVAVRSGERISGLEFFDVADRDEALRRFEEAARLDDPGRSRGSPSDLISAPNQALRVMEQIHECVRTGDFEGMVSHHAPDIVFEERRQTIKEEYGSEQLQAWGEWMREAGVRYEDVRFEVLAVRGERLCLGLQTYHARDDTGGGTEISWLLVTELNDEGLVSRFLMLEPDDAIAAHVALDERYDAQLPPDHAATRQALFESGWAYLDRDWERFRASLSEDFVFVDHRPAGWGVCDADTYIEHLSSLMGLAPDVDLFTPEIPGLTAGAALFRTVSRATGPAGGEVEFVIDHVSTVSDGRVTREEFFPPERRDDAIRRFEEVARLADAGSAVRMWQRSMWAQQANDEGALAAMAAEAAPGYRFHDHVAGAVLDAAEHHESIRLVAAMDGISLDWHPVLDLDHVAVVGVRHRWSAPTQRSDPWADAGGGDSEDLFICVLDESERPLEIHRFAEDQLHRAFAVAEERHAEIASDPEEAAASRRFARIWNLIDAYNRDDWAALREMWADDLVTVDHRPAGWGTIEGGDRYVEVLQGLAEVARERRWVIQDLLYRGGRGLAARWSVTGTDHEGGPFEILLLVAFGFDDEGRVSRQEIFPVDRLDDTVAVARVLEADSP